MLPAAKRVDPKSISVWILGLLLLLVRGLSPVIAIIQSVILISLLPLPLYCFDLCLPVREQLVKSCKIIGPKL